MIALYENATHLLVTADAAHLRDLSDAFKFQPNGYLFAPSYERYKVSKGREGWDGFIRPMKRLTDTSGQFPRGYKLSVIEYLDDRGLKYDTRKLLPQPFAGLTEQDVPPDIIAGDFALDDDQRRCIADWLSYGIGMNRVTVAGGKTGMFAGAAAMIRQRYPAARCIYMTPSERLVRQVTKEMKKFLPGWDVGQFGGGKKELKAADMVVCTVAMLNKHFSALKAHQWFNTFMVVLFDEAHHCGSKTAKKVLEEIPAFFRLGASDSVKEDDPVRSRDILGMFGPVLNDVTAAPLIAKGRIAVPHIYIVDDLNWQNRLRTVPYMPVAGSNAFVLMDGSWERGKYRGPVYEVDDSGIVKTKTVTTATWVQDGGDDGLGGWLKVEEPIIVQGLHQIEMNGVISETDSRWTLLERMYDRCIITFKERNDAIIAWTKHFVEQDFPTLVVATRTLHVYILESLLKKEIDPERVRILFGESTPKERDETFEWFRSTPGSVLVTPLVKEGVSINEIRAMVVADYISNWEVANQIVGRAIRQKESGRAEIVWFRDRQHPVLRRGCNAMFKNLEKIEGYAFYDPAPLSPRELL